MQILCNVAIISSSSSCAIDFQLDQKLFKMNASVCRTWCNIFLLQMMPEFQSIFSAAVSSAQWFHFLHLFICRCCFVVVVTVVDALFGVCACVYTSFCFQALIFSLCFDLVILYTSLLVYIRSSNTSPKIVHRKSVLISIFMNKYNLRVESHIWWNHF